jgi:hypothetical protein
VTTAAQLGCVVLCTHDDGHVATQEASEPFVGSRVVSLACGTETAVAPDDKSVVLIPPRRSVASFLLVNLARDIKHGDALMCSMH